MILDCILAFLLAAIPLCVLKPNPKRTLFDAQCGDTSLHAAQGEIAIPFNLNRGGFVLLIDANREVHPGGMALEANNEGQRLGDIPGDADVSRYINIGFASKDDLLDGTKWAVAVPEMAHVQRRDLSRHLSDELF